jgi:hypothetical protein
MVDWDCDEEVSPVSIVRTCARSGPVRSDGHPLIPRITWSVSLGLARRMESTESPNRRIVESRGASARFGAIRSTRRDPINSAISDMTLTRILLALRLRAAYWRGLLCAMLFRVTISVSGSGLDARRRQFRSSQHLLDLPK